MRRLNGVHESKGRIAVVLPSGSLIVEQIDSRLAWGRCYTRQWSVHGVVSTAGVNLRPGDETLICEPG